MVRFPYWGFPFQYPYYRYYNKQNYIQNLENIQKEKETLKQQTEEETSSVKFKTSSSQYRNHHSRVNYSLPITIHFDNFSNSDNPILELFGIKLYLDDIIILCLLFLLYKEDVKDEMLFIALILLLLT